MPILAARDSNAAAGRGGLTLREFVFLPSVSAVWRGFFGAAAIALCYQLIHWSHVVDPRILPSLTAILREMWLLAVDPEFLRAVLDTVKPALAGLAIASCVAIPLGLVLGMSPLANKVSRGLIDILRSLPGTALIPVFIITIGQGDMMKTVLVVYVTSWPILFNTIYGVMSVDKIAIESARSCRVEGLALWRRVVLPSAAPFIATGIRYALPISIVIVIAAELIVGSEQGIGGYLLLQQSDTVYRPDAIYAVLLMAGVVGFLLNAVMDRLCDWLVGWDTRRGEQS